MTSGVKLFNRIGQISSIQMGVDLCGGDAFVTQHFLHGAQVCSGFYQVRGKTVSKSMRANGFGNAGFDSQAFDE